MLCEVCQRPITILINQGTGVCCEMCKKARNGELTLDQVIAFIAEVNPKVLVHPDVRSFLARQAQN